MTAAYGSAARGADAACAPSNRPAGWLLAEKYGEKYGATTARENEAEAEAIRGMERTAPGRLLGAGLLGAALLGTTAVMLGALRTASGGGGSGCDGGGSDGGSDGDRGGDGGGSDGGRLRDVAKKRSAGGAGWTTISIPGPGGGGGGGTRY